VRLPIAQTATQTRRLKEPHVAVFRRLLHTC
jgi:hypothetical protein